MSKRLIVGLIVGCLAAPAFAQQPGAPSSAAPAGGAAGAPASGPQGGPWTRTPTKPDKKGIDDLFTASMDAWKKGDINAAAALIDFPVTMVTDNSKGEYMQGEWNRDKWVAEMGPAMQGMPKDVKMTHKHTPYFLSDTLAVVVEENSMQMGKQKAKWTGYSVVVNKGGKWMYKQMAEAGWGDTMGGGGNKPAGK
jgi:hypothetical protein